MKEGVNVYGGFSGFENSVTARVKSDLDTNGIIEAWEFTNATVLDGQNVRRVLEQTSSFTIQTTWDGLTIANGKSSSSAGGAYIQSNESLSNCIIKGNICTGTYANGGGVYNYGGTIYFCLITENSTSAVNGESHGGGICNYSGTVSYCKINRNICHSSGWAIGGGIRNNYGVVSHCTISENISNSSSHSIYTSSLGGGISCEVAAIINNCVVENNQVLKNGISDNTCQGGGIDLGKISCCIIKGNTAGFGGGLYGSLADNCLIINNTSSDCGGGAYNSRTTNCTFVGNTAFYQGGGVDAYSSSYAVATNCIFWGNSAPTGAQINMATVEYSAIQDGFTGIANIFLAASNDNDGPLFVDPIGEDYQLQICSPCINKGHSDPIYTDTATDLAGNPRIWQIMSAGIVDMGAYEFQSASNTSPVIITLQDSIFTSSNATGNQWYLNDTLIPGATGQVLVAQQPGTYHTITTNEYGCLVTSNTITYIPDCAYSISGRVLLNSNPLAGVIINCSNNTSAITNIAGEYTITVDSNASVTLTPSSSEYLFTPSSIQSNNVSSNLNDQNFVATLVGIDEILNEEGQIALYPNPVRNTLYFHSSLLIEQIDIYDINWRILQEATNPSQGIDVSDLPNGVYLIKLKTKNGEIIRKIIKM